MFSNFTAFIALLLITMPAQAIMTVQESAEITPQGNYKIGIEPQVITSTGGGFNTTGFFDAPINEQASYRIHLGTGDTDVYAGGSVKWVPFPDFDSQPAVGGKLSMILGNQNDLSLFVVRAEPIVSKKMETIIGLFIPYAALPINFVKIDGHSETGIQLAGGTEFIYNELENVTFGVELGLDVKDSFSYISGFATIYLDEGALKAQ